MTFAAEALSFGEDEDPLEYFFENGLTDGFPIVLPTRRRVAAMLRGTSFEAKHVLGKCPPSYFEVTIESTAIAAVMAGCNPEMFRIVVAAVKAMLDPNFGLHGVHATTMGATPVVVVNGPCRDVAKVNYKHAPCGAGNRSTSIGRALKLVLQNVGRAKLAGTESTTIGTPMKFGMCFGEHEEHAKLWEPLSTTNSDLQRGEDAVTVCPASSGPVQFADLDATPEQLVDRLAQTVCTGYARHMPFVNQSLVIVSPEHYNTLLKAGLDTKKKFTKALYDATARHMLPFSEYHLWVYFKRKFGSAPAPLVKICSLILRLISYLARFAGWKICPFPKFSSLESIKVVVAGGPAGKFTSFMPGFGVGESHMSTANMSAPITKAIEPRPGSLDDPAEDVPEPERVLDPVQRRGVALLGSKNEAQKCFRNGKNVPCPPKKGQVAERLLADRTGSLLGPVALLDISKPKGSDVLDLYEEKLKAMGIETKRYRKPTFSRPAPATLIETIQSECKSAIVGLAD
mmetsp:Transcript_92763/g.203108  ORF Transcript_92763/g.203108 Transcript_92763/m.203108 type:complete len:513 (+) Transcript_92763:162-1700(+)